MCFYAKNAKQMFAIWAEVCYTEYEKVWEGIRMPRTSDKSELILEFVSNFIQENGYAPSVREIGAGVGLRSTASVSYHLRALQDKGLLQGGESKGR